MEMPEIELAEMDIDQSHIFGSLQLAVQYFGTQAISNIFAASPAAGAPTDMSSVTADVGAEGISVPVNITEQGTFIDPSANMDWVMAPGDMTVPTGESLGLTPPDLGVDVTVTPTTDGLGDVSPPSQIGDTSYMDAGKVIEDHFQSMEVGLESTKEFFADTVPTTKFNDLNYELMVSNYDDYFDEMVDFG